MKAAPSMPRRTGSGNSGPVDQASPAAKRRPKAATGTEQRVVEEAKVKGVNSYLPRERERVCVCVRESESVCVREREGGRERERER